MHPPRFKNQTEADGFYMSEAIRVRAFSDDPKASLAPQSGVGVVIADLNGIVVLSANVLPPDLKSAREKAGRAVLEADRYFVIEHAERAALFTAWQRGHDLAHATLYCTRFPCSDCARAIAWSSIRRVVLPTGFSGEVRWLDAQRAALGILRDVGVRLRYLGKGAALVPRDGIEPPTP